MEAVARYYLLKSDFANGLGKDFNISNCDFFIPSAQSFCVEVEISLKLIFLWDFNFRRLNSALGF